MPIFKGLNFFDWNEQVQFYLGVLDLDLVVLEEKPIAITNASSIEKEAIIRLEKNITDSA